MRRCVQLRFGQGLKYKEVAEALGISIETVKSQLHNATRRLRPLVASYFDRGGSGEGRS
jgi:RNA polymerase sigma factor (sigma-70 family)